MKILRIFGLIGLVIFTILLIVGCGRVPENDSTSNEYLKVISSISSSVINACLLYTSDAADDSLRVDLGGRRSIKNFICY